MARVAHVLPLLEVFHLDRLFDYAIPEQWQNDLVVGMKVRVRFHRRLVDGIVYGISDHSDFLGTLSDIERIVSPLVMVNDSMRELVDRIAYRYCGSRPDILRLVLPHRIAKAEKDSVSKNLSSNKEQKPSRVNPVDIATIFPGTQLAKTPATADRVLRIVAQLPPYQNWCEILVQLIQVYQMHDLAMIIVLPTYQHIARMEEYITQSRDLDQGKIVIYTAKQTPYKRYRNWIAIALDEVKVVIGPRGAIYSPFVHVDCIIVFDDGDENYSEPLKPYPHTRMTAIQRSLIDRSDIFFIGYARTVETQALVNSGWAQSLSFHNPELLPRSQALPKSYTEDPALSYQRLPSPVFQVIHRSLGAGENVLIHVYRKGYSHALYCYLCHGLARCRACHGVLSRKIDGSLKCQWCGQVTENFSCINCGNHKLAISQPGIHRTAEEIGKAFADVPVLTFSQDSHSDTPYREGDTPYREGDTPYREGDTPDREGPLIVIATTGSERFINNKRYGAGIVLDITSHLLRPDLRAGEMFFRTVMNFMSYLRPQAELLLCSQIDNPLINNIVRYRPIDFIDQELQERNAAHFPPGVRLATIDGSENEIADFMSCMELPVEVEKLGPIVLAKKIVDLMPIYEYRIVLRIDIAQADLLNSTLIHAMNVYGKDKRDSYVRVAIDPLHIG